MDCGDAGGEEAFSAEKTRSRSQKKRNREWGELWTHLFFSKKLFEVWLIFSVALSSAAQQCDSVIHIKCIFSYSFFMWFNTEYWIQFLMLYSRTLLFFIPLFPQLPVLHSPHPSSWQPHVLALFGFGWTLTSPAAEKTPLILTKRGK